MTALQRSRLKLEAIITQFITALKVQVQLLMVYGSLQRKHEQARVAGRQVNLQGGEGRGAGRREECKSSKCVQTNETRTTNFKH